MTDQHDEPWNNAGSTPQPPRRDPDATVVVPARPPDAPPGAQPPHYAHQPPQHASAPQQYTPAPPGAPSFGGPQFVQPTGPASRYRAPGGSIAMLVGAAVAIVGTFLPWVTFDGGSTDGYESYVIGDDFDGVMWDNPGAWVVVAMVVVIISAVLVLVVGRRVITWIFALLAAGLGGLIALGALGAVGSVLNAFEDSGLGVGVVLCLVGAIVSGVGAIVIVAKRS